MPSSKHERLYGAPVQREMKKKVGEPLTETMTQRMMRLNPAVGIHPKTKKLIRFQEVAD